MKRGDGSSEIGERRVDGLSASMYTEGVLLRDIILVLHMS